MFHIKAYPLETISAMRPDELVALMERGELSLLKSFRIGRKRFLKRCIAGPRPSLRQVSGLISWTFGLWVMKYIVGPICRFVLWCVMVGGKGPQDAQYWCDKREKSVRVVRRFCPDEVRGTLPTVGQSGLIVGFSHPTLHEVLSLVGWSLAHFPDRRNNFPTNLPWYENVCTCAPVLRQLGICITPLITQSTFRKLERIHQGDTHMMETIGKVREMLLQHYFTTAIAFERTGDNTFSAPSATRQATIFPKEPAYYDKPGAERLLPAMSGLMFWIARANKDRKPDVTFLPVTVIPPVFRIKRLKGLKLFRRYTLVVGKGLTMEEARKLGRGIDYAFLERLAENAPEEYKYPKKELSQ